MAPHVRALIAQLPDEVMVDAALPPDPDQVPEAAPALCKLALGRGRVRLRSLSRSEEARVLIARRDKRVIYGPPVLARGLPALVERMLVDLFDGADFLASLSSLARASCTLETLQRVTAHMLRAADADSALHAMLSGVTSGFGLGLNRAAIFVADDRGLVGARGVGPATAEEAHRTWEEMEARGLTLDDFVAGGEPGGFHVRTEGRVLPEEHEVAVALAGSAPLAWSGPAASPALRALAGSEVSFVLAPIRSRGRTLGLLYGDNCYTQQPVARGDLQRLGVFLDQAALAWENLTLLRRVETLAREDALTGLLSRGEIERRLSEESERAVRGGAPVALLVVDVDRFKEVNDTRGHAAGDALLRELGAILKKALRAVDVVGRIGGDEFLVLMPQTGREQARAVASRVGALARAGGISLSVGGACWPGDSGSPRELLEAADRNLYRSKRAGRGRACLASTEIPLEHKGLD